MVAVVLPTSPGEFTGKQSPKPSERVIPTQCGLNSTTGTVAHTAHPLGPSSTKSRRTRAAGGSLLLSLGLQQHPCPSVGRRPHARHLISLGRQIVAAAAVALPGPEL